MERPRPIVVHIHLFKNAGSSVDSGLQEHFGNSWASHDRTDTNAYGEMHLRNWLSERPELSAVSSHQFRPPLHSDETFQFIPVVFLRHPLDRIRSAFDFEKKQGPLTPSSTVAAETDMAGWIDFHRSRNSAQCSDFHLSALSVLRFPETTGLRRKLPKDQHLESAKEFLEGLSTFGIVEEFDRSWRRITDAIRPSFPDFAVSPADTNKTLGRSANMADRLAALAEELGEQEYSRLEWENEHDLRLYEWATQHFDRESDD